jgi:hypothetical protein
MPIDGKTKSLGALPADPVTGFHRPFPFRWVLPFGQLIVCVALLWQAKEYIAWGFGLHLPPSMFGAGAFVGSETALTAVAALNLPAGLVQLPYAIFSPEHTNWMPAGMDFKVWRAVTWPFIGLVFWWLPGRGIEALSAIKYRQLLPRIGWAETIVGFLVMAAGATLLIGFLFVPPADRADLKKFAAAGGLWALLGGLSVVARIAQWRLRRKRAGSQPTS